MILALDSRPLTLDFIRFNQSDSIRGGFNGRMKTVPILLTCVSILAAEARAQSSFYWPKQGTPIPPQSDSYRVEAITIESGAVHLSAWVLEPTVANGARSTVVF